MPDESVQSHSIIGVCLSCPRMSIRFSMSLQAFILLTYVLPACMYVVVVGIFKCTKRLLEVHFCMFFFVFSLIFSSITKGRCSFSLLCQEIDG